MPIDDRDIECKEAACRHGNLLSFTIYYRCNTSSPKKKLASYRAQQEALFPAKGEILILISSQKKCFMKC